MNIKCNITLKKQYNVKNRQYILSTQEINSSKLYLCMIFDKIIQIDQNHFVGLQDHIYIILSEIRLSIIGI